MLPEMIAGNVSEEFNISRKTDIWSFGCEAVEYFVMNRGSPKIPDSLPPIIRGFIEICIQREPLNRPSAT